MKTRVTELLDIKYPIIQGGMQNIAYPELCAAVSEAGGMGTLNTTIYPDLKDFRKAVKKVKSLTKKNFCVNMSLLPDAHVGENIKQYITICAEEGVKAIETAGIKPDALVSLIKDAGIVHIHKVPATNYALSAQRCGVDAVTCVGFECGGHPGADNIGTIVLAREASKKCSIPVIAGGGIVDGYGMAAALALGAEGIIMGTRFLATQEAPISQAHKDWILQATERSTTIAQQSIKNQIRVAKNEASQTCLHMEANGANLKELLPVISGARGKAAYASGDVDSGMYPMGIGCSLIEKIVPVAVLIEEMVTQLHEATQRLAHLCKG